MIFVAFGASLVGRQTGHLLAAPKVAPTVAGARDANDKHVAEWHFATRGEADGSFCSPNFPERSMITAMCARIRIQEVELKPCQLAGFWRGPGRCARRTWAGFTQVATLGWWETMGGVLVDIPATHFAQNEKDAGRLIWFEIPRNHVIRGVLDRRDHEHLLKVVIRQPTRVELETLDHPRMPLIAPPLFSAEHVPAA